jgi:hypothetical protein
MLILKLSNGIPQLSPTRLHLNKDETHWGFNAFHQSPITLLLISLTILFSSVLYFQFRRGQ